MKWIAILALGALATACSDGEHSSHREYIITQSQLDTDFVGNLMELPEE